VLGDPIEIAALNEAFQDSNQPCAIGSVKTNVGHLDTVSGVTGLIKTVCALDHRQIPPSLHFQSPNPAINFDRGPFYVNTQLTDWPTQNTPRRAGVSSFGIGGTNAHVVLEEAPLLDTGSSPGRATQLIPLSAKTPTALTTQANNLAAYLQANPDIPLADVAHTLSRGRRTLNYRHTLVANTVDQAVAGLEAWAAQPQQFSRPDDRPAITFMFSGQGSQYVNMGQDLYDSEPIFRETVDRCADILLPILGEDLRQLLYPANKSLVESCTQNLSQTALTQPALFVVEYALAQLWMAWGVEPQAMIGHSIGEYVAACIAGVFSLEDGLKLVTSRGRLMQTLPPGSMLVISLPEDQVMTLIQDYDDVDLATLLEKVLSLWPVTFIKLF
jgi:acyl transferase domain-containing protein